MQTLPTHAAWSPRSGATPGSASPSADRRAAGRPRRAAAGRPDRRPVAGHGRRAGPRLRPRRARDLPARRRAGPGSAAPPAATCPGRVRLIFQPAEEVMPGGAFDLVDAGVLEGVERDLRPALRPVAGRRHGRACATGRSPSAADADHGAADRPGRPHLPAAPDRGPDLRPRQGHHRRAGRAVPPARPAGRRRPWSGATSAPGSPQNVIPASARSGAPCGCSTRRPGPRCADIVTAAGPRGRRAVRRHGRGRLRPRRPAGRERAGAAGELAAAAAGTAARARSAAPSRAWAARTSPGTCRRCPARWPGWAPGRRAARSSTCTRATCGWTTAACRSGTALLAQTALTRLR